MRWLAVVVGTAVLVVWMAVDFEFVTGLGLVVAAVVAAADSIPPDLVSSPAKAPEACYIPPLAPQIAVSPPLSCPLPANWGLTPDDRDMELFAFVSRRRTC